jgi:hypothetical protein
LFLLLEFEIPVKLAWAWAHRRMKILAALGAPCPLRFRISLKFFQHSAAQPQPKLASAAKASFIKASLRPGSWFGSAHHKSPALRGEPKISARRDEIDGE